MAGYMLQLYQNAHPAEYTKGAFDEFFKAVNETKEFNHVEYIMYGDFNRLEVNLVDSFRKFRDLSEQSRRWLGRRQSVLLYEIEKTEKRLEYNEKVGFVVCKNKRKKQKTAKQCFFVFSMLSFTNEVISQVKDSKEFIKNVKTHILYVIDKAKGKAKNKALEDNSSILL